MGVCVCGNENRLWCTYVIMKKTKKNLVESENGSFANWKKIVKKTLENWKSTRMLYSLFYVLMYISKLLRVYIV